MASTPTEEERAAQLLALPHYRPWFYDLVRGTSALLLRSVFRLRTEGLENVPLEGGVVLAPMHRSYIDTLAVGVSLRSRRFRAMAKYELFFVPLIGRAIALGGGFPVRRGVQDTAAYETAMALLHEGAMLLVFPEGTRNRHGKARPQLGAARLALEAGAAFERHVLEPCGAQAEHAAQEQRTRPAHEVVEPRAVARQSLQLALPLFLSRRRRHLRACRDRARDWPRRARRRPRSPPPPRAPSR